MKLSSGARGGSIRVLLLEDSAIDAELISEHFAAAGLTAEIERVWTRNDFEAAVKNGSYDVILADHVLPQFDGDTALDIARVEAPNTPFVFVSGTLSEELAVQALRRGATDYVVKQRLKRLPDVTRRAIAEAREKAERRKAEQTLRATERELEAILNNATVSIFVMDGQQRCSYMNAAAEQLTGYSLAETQGRILHDVIHHTYPDGTHFPLSECPIDRALPEDNQVGGEATFIHKNGSFYPVAFTASPIRDDSGHPVGTIIEVRSIADEKAREAALRASEDRFRLAARATTDTIWDWDLLKDEVQWSDALCEAHGYRPTEVRASSSWWVERIHQDDVDRVRSSIRKVIGGSDDRWTEEYRFRRADGSYADILDRAYVARDEAGTAIRMIGAMLDQTDRKAAEQALAESEAKFQGIANSVDQMIWSTGPDGHHDYFNRRWYEYTGVPEGSTDGDGWNELFHPDDQERAWNRWSHSLATGKPYHIEYRLRHRTGKYRWVLGRAQPVATASGNIVRWYGTCTDIHDLKLVEEELRRTSALLHLIGDSTPDMIYAKDLKSRVLYANKAVQSVIGLPPEKILGHSDLDWAADPEEAEAILANDRCVMESGQTVDADEVFTGPDGSQRHFRSVKAPLRTAAGEIIGLVGVTSDMTVRKLAEERERLLAREVDHRAKNLLAVVQSVVQLTRASDVASFTSAITGRIQSLSRAHSLLAASRWEGARLQQLVADELAPFSARDASRVRIDGPDILLKPEAAQALGLVLHELATNAAKYGSLSVAGGRLEVLWNVANEGEARGGLELSWQEDGGPLVSKPARRGFGSTVIKASVERQLGGTVSLEFDPRGLRCKLVLPAGFVAAEGSEEEVPVGKAAEDRGAEPPKELRGLRVLVVEDEALISLQVEAALEAAGSRVVGPVGRISNAFQIFYTESFDAALLDISVAGERSYPLAEALQAKGVPFVFMTGFEVASSVPEQFRTAPVVKKPFSSRELLTALQQMR